VRVEYEEEAVGKWRQPVCVVAFENLYNLQCLSFDDLFDLDDSTPDEL
jgi:hypothetical protein